MYLTFPGTTAEALVGGAYLLWNSDCPRARDGRSRRPRLKPSHHRPRLTVEQLEVRMLPSTFYAATVSDLIADIRAANTSGGSNSIILTAPTTSPYVLTAVDNTTDGPTGLPVIAAGNNLTIAGNGDTVQRSTAAGTPNFRLLDVASGGSLTLQNLTLQNGVEDGTETRGAFGGGIYNRGSLTLSAVTVVNNYALAWGKLSLAFYGGPAGGGGIASFGAMTLENGTLIQSNSALGGDVRGDGPGGDAWGGGVYVGGGTADLTGVTLSRNTAQGGRADENWIYPNAFGGSAFGGGLSVSAGTVNVSGSTVSSNLALGGNGYDGRGGDAYGSGIYAGSGYVSLTVSLRSDTVQNNVAKGGFGYFDGVGRGGGIYIPWFYYVGVQWTVYLDAFTVANTINNTADWGPNINPDALYTLL